MVDDQSRLLLQIDAASKLGIKIAFQVAHLSLHLLKFLNLVVKLVLFLLLELLHVRSGVLVSHRNHSLGHPKLERAIFAQSLINRSHGVHKVIKLFLQLLYVFLHVVVLHVELAEHVDSILVSFLDLSVLLFEGDASWAHLTNLCHV